MNSFTTGGGLFSRKLAANLPSLLHLFTFPPLHPPFLSMSSWRRLEKFVLLHYKCDLNVWVTFWEVVLLHREEVSNPSSSLNLSYCVPPSVLENFLTGIDNYFCSEITNTRSPVCHSTSKVPIKTTFVSVLCARHCFPEFRKLNETKILFLLGNEDRTVTRPSNYCLTSHQETLKS